MKDPLHIAVWNWRREPVPGARVVVCRPGLLDNERYVDPIVLASVPDGKRIFIAPGLWEGGERPVRGIIPSGYAERPADLARLPDLLAVKAERRALVLCPREAIDLLAPNLWFEDRDEQVTETILAALDFVVIIPPPDADPWPMHPAWVRKIVEQCRAAGVPVCFLGWGAWAPFYDRDKDDPDWRSVPKEGADVVRINADGGRGFHGEQVVYFRRSSAFGRTLDGAEVMEIPDWLEPKGDSR